MAEDKINIRELSFEELQEHLSKLKQQAFRSKQVFEWLWKKMHIHLKKCQISALN